MRRKSGRAAPHPVAAIDFSTKTRTLLSMHGHSRLLCVVFFFPAVIMFAACKTPRKNYLPNRVNAYNEALKWKNYYRAADYVADREDFLKKVKKSNSRIEIEEWEIVSIRVNPNGTEAIVEVRRVYTISPSVTVHKQVLEQKWKYDPKQKDWFLVTPY